MSVVPGEPTVSALVDDLRVLRERGLTRLRHTDLPSLRLLADRFGDLGIEEMLRKAVENLGDSELGKAAMATFGLESGKRDKPASDRRRRAALIYGLSIERFRKHQERILIEQVAEEILKLASRPSPQPQRPLPPSPPARQVVLRGQVAGQALTVIVRAEPVELLADVDVLVVPTNSYMEPPQLFKSSVSAAVRRMAATKNADGHIAIDVVGADLAAWVSKNARPGLAVALGAVAPTSAGEMIRRGIRRLYHVAVVSPQPSSNNYVVEPVAIAEGVRNVLALAQAERGLFSPGLRSIAFPLLGAGRGGLDPVTSFDWIWGALERELAGLDQWEIQFFARRPEQAALMASRLAAAGLTADQH
ncbi:MAG TPA: hypothetical protein VFI65_02895 [Streptosporangiaceae bacterium]|nr:hypothetical protein [Streptosporangiaceae bacterium]